MTEKPILFNTEMVRAILDGRKTQTRRIIKDLYFNPLISGDLKWHAPVNSGDILWVRETWKQYTTGTAGPGLIDGYLYKADEPQDTSGMMVEGRWRPSIHMPKEAARIFLRVKNVRPERLQDSFNDIVTAVKNYEAEGIDIGEVCKSCIEDYYDPTCRAYDDEDGMMTRECHMLDQARSDFSDLWDKTIKPADLPRFGWAANPWVWVISFKKIERDQLSELRGARR